MATAAGGSGQLRQPLPAPASAAVPATAPPRRAGPQELSPPGAGGLVANSRSLTLGELFTEVLGFLWPFLLEPIESLLGWPVLLPGCDPKDAYSVVLHQLLREQHTFPLLEQHLPEALHLERVLIPSPGFQAACRLHAGVSAGC